MNGSVMTREITFEAAPDLKRIYATALVTGRGTAGPLPDVRAVRRGIRVDVEKLVDYARVCGFTVGATLPLSYPHMLAFPLQMALMSDRDFPLGLTGAVHLENVITTTRPIAVEETLDLTVWAKPATTPPGPAGRPRVRGECRRRRRLAGREHLSGQGHGAPGCRAVRAAVGRLQDVVSGPTWRLGDDVGRRYARCRATGTPSTCTPSRPGRSVSRPPSRTACTATPEWSPPSARRSRTRA